MPISSPRRCQDSYRVWSSLYIRQPTGEEFQGSSPIFTSIESVLHVHKASGLSADKNPNGELGLFEYIDSYDMNAGEYFHEYLTEFEGVYREDKANPRKSYWATTFKRGKEIEAESNEKIIEMIKEVHEKVGTKFADEYVPPVAEVIDYPTEDINPDDVPF